MATDSTLRILQKERGAAPIGSQTAFRILADLWALTKPEINFLIAITVLVSFLVAHQGSQPVSIILGFNAIAGTLFVSSGAAVLNQFMERNFDSRMRRTSRRPLVMGSIAPRSALLFGATISILGLLYLELWVNPLSSFIAVITSAMYLAVYTPLKRITPLCTAIGAIPGAAPPLIGWAAATGALGNEAWTLYAMLFLWQFPHFMAIAWMYREDYERAGYRVLPGHRVRGLFAAIMAAVPAVLTITANFVPWAEMKAGNLYAATSCFLGFVFLFAALRFARIQSNSAARQLLFVSIVYLPAIFALLLLDRR